jgi:hypothetical protein
MKRKVVMFVLFLWALGSAKAQADVSLHELDQTVAIEETVVEKPVLASEPQVVTNEETPPSPTVFASFTAAIPAHLRRLQMQEITGSSSVDVEQDYSELIALYTCQQDFNLDENVDEIVLLKNKDGKGGVLACLCSIGDGFSYLELEVFTAAQFATKRLQKSYIRSFLCHYDAATDALIESTPFDQPLVHLVEEGVEEKKPFLFNPRRQEFESFWMACY